MYRARVISLRLRRGLIAPLALFRRAEAPGETNYGRTGVSDAKKPAKVRVDKPIMGW